MYISVKVLKGGGVDTAAYLKFLAANKNEAMFLKLEQDAATTHFQE